MVGGGEKSVAHAASILAMMINPFNPILVLLSFASPLRLRAFAVKI
jgi:hypothetical protein